MKANLFLFAIKQNDENSPYSHLTLGDSVSHVVSKFNDDLSFLLNSISSADDKVQVDNILSYFKSCSLWCLGSIDFVSGQLTSHIEQHDNLVNLLEVLKNE